MEQAVRSRILILIITMYIFRFAEGMRKAGSNQYKNGTKETRKTEIKIDKGGVQPWIVRGSIIKVGSDAASQCGKSEYASEKPKLKNEFHKTIKSFLGLFVSSGMGVIYWLSALNVRITSLKHDRRSTVGFEAWLEPPNLGDGKVAMRRTDAMLTR